jgi:hypothetical protein
MQSQSHVNAINDINEKIEQQQQRQQQQQDPIQSHPYDILHFLELRRSRL